MAVCGADQHGLLSNFNGYDSWVSCGTVISGAEILGWSEGL